MIFLGPADAPAKRDVTILSFFTIHCSEEFGALFGSITAHHTSPISSLSHTCKAVGGAARRESPSRVGESESRKTRAARDDTTYLHPSTTLAAHCPPHSRPSILAVSSETPTAAGRGSWDLHGAGRVSTSCRQADQGGEHSHPRRHPCSRLLRLGRIAWSCAGIFGSVLGLRLHQIWPPSGGRRRASRRGRCCCAEGCGRGGPGKSSQKIGVLRFHCGDTRASRRLSAGAASTLPTCPSDNARQSITACVQQRSRVGAAVCMKRTGSGRERVCVCV